MYLNGNNYQKTVVEKTSHETCSLTQNRAMFAEIAFLCLQKLLPVRMCTIWLFVLPNIVIEVARATAGNAQLA